MKRFFDVVIALIGLLVLFIPGLLIALAIKLNSKGPVIHWSKRIGKNNTIFFMPKFRTMQINTPQKATHLLKDSSLHITGFGYILRKLSLDELPQLYSVLKSDMSLVGPRPALFNQHDLIELRTNSKLHKLKPGITGWAQVNGRDELTIEEKVKFDSEYLLKNSISFDLYIIWLTIRKLLNKEGITH
tara:strand:+ start:1441 stop:2001 length:561 start_codon:yes stop_codon:yes gene_type:complete